MRADVARDMTDSSFDFMRVVVPAISRHIGGGRVEPVESSTSTGMTKSLDMLAGIDAWQVVTNEGVRGLASRVQWGDRCWGTFTVREHRPNGATTELEKRLQGAGKGSRGFIYPHLTVQAYVTEPRGQGHLVGVAVARTDDIMDYVAMCLDICGGDVPGHPDHSAIWRKSNGDDGVTFLCVPWQGMLECVYDVKVITPLAVAVLS